MEQYSRHSSPSNLSRILHDYSHERAESELRRTAPARYHEVSPSVLHGQAQPQAHHSLLPPARQLTYGESSGEQTTRQERKEYSTQLIIEHDRFTSQYGQCDFPEYRNQLDPGFGSSLSNRSRLVAQPSRVQQIVAQYSITTASPEPPSIEIASLGRSDLASRLNFHPEIDSSTHELACAGSCLMCLRAYEQQLGQPQFTQRKTSSSTQDLSLAGLSSGPFLRRRVAQVMPVHPGSPRPRSDVIDCTDSESHVPYKPINSFHGPTQEKGNEKDDCDETFKQFKHRLIKYLAQMMFVSGETAEASVETTWMIEEIVREQVVEMLKEATILANRRGSKSISIVDLIFQIRHDTAKVSRLKTFLSWKDVRKNVKDSDDKAGGGDADALDLEDAAVPGANPAAPQKTTANKKAKLILPWEVQSYYSEQVPEREDEEDEEEEEQNEATLARLASADERTRNMTKDEYVHWSDCRQASFTFRKGKRFREWAGFGTVIDSKPNDDVVDILGFLTFEIVQTITEEALKVKSAEDLANKKANGGRGDIEATKKRKREGCTLFEMPEEGRTPVEPKHVREAFRRLQIVPSKYKFMRQGYAGIRTPLRMI